MLTFCFVRAQIPHQTKASASFYISHLVAAFLQKYSGQQLKLEESDNSTRNRNQSTDTKQVKMKSSKMVMVPKQNKGFQTQSLFSNVIASSLSAVSFLLGDFRALLVSTTWWQYDSSTTWYPFSVLKVTILSQKSRGPCLYPGFQFLLLTLL